MVGDRAVVGGTGGHDTRWPAACLLLSCGGSASIPSWVEPPLSPPARCETPPARRVRPGVAEPGRCLHDGSRGVDPPPNRRPSCPSAGGRGVGPAVRLVGPLVPGPGQVAARWG